MNLDLEKIPIPGMIHLHRKTWDILFNDLLKATLKLSKLQTSKSKIENQLRKEKVENKSHQEQIKKLQMYLLATKGQEDKGARIQKLVNEKENVIQLLKNKLKITSIQVIHASKLAEIEKKKESLSSELTDCKVKLLKFVEKEK